MSSLKQTNTKLLLLSQLIAILIMAPVVIVLPFVLMLTLNTIFLLGLDYTDWKAWLSCATILYITYSFVPKKQVIVINTKE